MKHPHAEILQAYILDTSVEFEGSRNGGMWYTTSIDSVIYNPEQAFRIKPKERCVVIVIDGMEYKFPEPLRVAPVMGSRFYVATKNEVTSFIWVDFYTDKDFLKAGFCQATEAGAEAQRRAIIALNGGCA